jgi:Flp pilus assembly protein TadD
MKHVVLFALVLSVAACGQPGRRDLTDAAPGLDVARAALEGGSPAVALSVTEGLLEKDPKDAAALVYRGDALAGLGRNADAEGSYRAALAIDAASVGAQMGLGRLRLRIAPAEAQALFLDVLRRDPRNKAALNDLGIACDLQGDHAAAQEAYRKALGADPSMRAAEVNLAMSMALTGRAPEAIKILRPVANEPGATTRVRHDLAAALALAGDKDGASRILSNDMSAEEVRKVLVAHEAFGK